MAKTKYSIDDYMTYLAGNHLSFFSELHKELTNYHYEASVEEKKSGFALAYIEKESKTTLLNCVSRKNGIFIRLYGNHSKNYIKLFDTLPQSMIIELKKGKPCKRSIDPRACNSRCKMGIDIPLNNEIINQCRNSAMFFLLVEEKYQYIQKLILEEITQRSKH